MKCEYGSMRVLEDKVEIRIEICAEGELKQS